MNWKNPALHTLGLGQKEKEILTLLRDPLSIQELARTCSVPRTTGAYIIKKLIKRGLIEKVKMGKRYKYYSISQERFKLLLEGIHTVENSKKISYVQGLKNITRLQSEFLSSYQNERIYAIQPNKSWSNLHSKVDEEQVIHVNKIIRNNNLIMDAVVESNAYDNFKKVNQSKRKFLKLAKSFGDRMADYASAPPGFMTDQVEMWIIKNTVIFIDWREEVAIKIVDAHITHFLKDMFLLTKEAGKKIDHNRSIREVIEK